MYRGYRQFYLSEQQHVFRAMSSFLVTADATKSVWIVFHKILSLFQHGSEQMQFDEVLSKCQTDSGTLAIIHKLYLNSIRLSVIYNSSGNGSHAVWSGISCVSNNFNSYNWIDGSSTQEHPNFQPCRSLYVSSSKHIELK